MKLIVLLIIILCLFLIYRLSFPKQPEKQTGKTPPEADTDESEVIGKSRFVLPSHSQPRTTPATTEKTLVSEEKHDTFAPEIQNRTAVIPPEELDEVFGKEVNPEDLDIDETDEDGGDTEENDEDEEELRRTMNGSMAYADGYTIDEIAEAVKTADQPESDQSPEAVETLYHLSKTDMFEQLVSGDASRATRIAAILDRREWEQRVENGDADNNDSAYSDFNIGNFINRKKQ
jgi:hypothetical protein